MYILGLTLCVCFIVIFRKTMLHWRRNVLRKLCGDWSSILKLHTVINCYLITTSCTYCSVDKVNINFEFTNIIDY